MSSWSSQPSSDPASAKKVSRQVVPRATGALGGFVGEGIAGPIGAIAGSGVGTHIGEKLVDAMSSGQRPSTCNVHVRNLAWATSSDSLRAHFSTCGNVVKAQVKRKGGRSCGWGIVEFDSPQTALTAISSMNSSHFDVREIFVLFASCHCVK